MHETLVRGEYSTPLKVPRLPARHHTPTGKVEPNLGYLWDQSPFSSCPTDNVENCNDNYRHYGSS